jgi:hypothetical protein
MDYFFYAGTGIHVNLVALAQYSCGFWHRGAYPYAMDVWWLRDMLQNILFCNLRY